MHRLEASGSKDPPFLMVCAPFIGRWFRRGTRWAQTSIFPTECCTAHHHLCGVIQLFGSVNHTPEGQRDTLLRGIPGSQDPPFLMVWSVHIPLADDFAEKLGVPKLSFSPRNFALHSVIMW